MERGGPNVSRTGSVRSCTMRTRICAVWSRPVNFSVVIGQPGHVEVRGLTEDFPDAMVISESGRR